MKLSGVVLLACLALVSASSYYGDHHGHSYMYRFYDKHKEYDPDVTNDDPEVSKDDIKHYAYPAYYHRWERKEDKMCADYKSYAKPKDECEESRKVKSWKEWVFNKLVKYVMVGPKECDFANCDYVITKGTTKCMTEVELYKTYRRRGAECESPLLLKSCSKSKKSSSSIIEVNHNGEMVPGSGDGQTDDMGCSCQTIWCQEEISTVYKMGGKMYKGRVNVKFPCDCECRKNIP